MTLIERYYIKEFMRLFVILGIGLSIVASLIEFINRIDDFMPHNPPFNALLYYCLLNIPSYLLYTMPVCILLSSLFVIGNAGKARETIAIRASGGSLKRMLSVFIFTGVIMTFLSFLIGEFIAPSSARKAHELREVLSRSEGLKNQKLLWGGGDMIWLRSKEDIVRIDLYLPDKEMIKGISIFRMKDDMLSERIEADYAQWRPVWEESKKKGGIWVLRKGTIYNISTGQVRTFSELPVEIMPPRAFNEKVRKPDEMNIGELLRYIKRLKEAGFKNNKILVDLQSRIAYPLINLIMMILGTSLATSGFMRSGLITAAIGIGISLLYWLCLSIVLSMSYTGILPPFGPWSIPLMFGLYAIYRFAKIPE